MAATVCTTCSDIVLYERMSGLWTFFVWLCFDATGLCFKRDVRYHAPMVLLLLEVTLAVCLSHACHFWSCDSCLLTPFCKQFSISLPCQVICWHGFQCNTQFRGDLFMFLFLLHLERCRFASVDIALQALFHFNAMPGDLLTLFSKQLPIAMPCKVIGLCFEWLHLECCRFSWVWTLLVSTYLFVRCNNHKCVQHLCEEVTMTWLLLDCPIWCFGIHLSLFARGSFWYKCPPCTFDLKFSHPTHPHLHLVHYTLSSTISHSHILH